MSPDKHFPLDTCFPEAESVLTASFTALSEIKNECLVGLDTSALLAPYKLDSASLDEIKTIYGRIGKAGRLVVPAQSLREYAKNRPTKIADLVKTLYDQSSRATAPVEKTKVVRFLVNDANYTKALEISEQIGKLAKEFQKTMSNVVDNLSNWTKPDPVLGVYRDVLKGRIYELTLNDDERKQFTEEMKFRYEHRIPPGFNDNKKPDEGSGDFIIWKTILEIGGKKKAPFLFVTFEEKNDWLVQTSGRIQPRYELLDEYRRASGGKTFHILSLAGFLKLFEARAEVVTAAETAEREVHQQNIDEQTELPDERSAIESRLIQLQSQIRQLGGSLKDLPLDYNESLSLPWNRAAHGFRNAF